MLEEAKQHIKEMLNLIQHSQRYSDLNIDPGYSLRLKEFVEKFQFWNPECHAFIEGGNLQGISANCSLVFSLFDVDNEKADTENPIPFQERLDEWNRMIDESHQSGTLKPIL